MLEFTFLESNEENLDDPRENAALRFDVNIQLGTEKEQHDGAYHEDGWDGKPPHPTYRVLDVDHKRQGNKQNDSEGGVVPIEEAIDVFPAFLSG